jgi:hypothetical protein
MRRPVVAIASTLLAAGLLGGCGSSSSSPSSGPLPTKVIDITFNGSSVTPNGTTIDVAVGQRLEFDVTADVAGEIHVHSSPAEQEFEYDKGSSTFDVKPIPAPGRVVVESHTLNKTLFILQAQ